VGVDSVSEESHPLVSVVPQVLAAELHFRDGIGQGEEEWGNNEVAEVYANKIR